MKSLARFSFSGLLALIHVPLGQAIPNCPLLGPEFPPPQRLAQHPIWRNAIAQVDAIFNYLDSSSIKGIDEVSYAIQVLSTNPGPPILWERYQTSKSLPEDTPGVKQVDGDTVFRLGSVSKIFTVLAFLAEVGDVYWNQPITRFIPELARFAGRTQAKDFDSVRETAWDELTLGSLASQVSGLGRDYGVLGEITQTEKAPEPWRVGLSALPERLMPSCGAWPLCTRQEFLRGITTLYPSFAPGQTATYSDIGFQLLAYALESISGKKYEDILNDRVLKPLQLNHTYLNYAPPSVGIMAGPIKDSYWNVSLGDANPSGNMYSSANDLSALGRAILSSKLLKPSVTRRWLNPVTFSSELIASVGAPWGVRRIQLDPWRQPHRTLSMFTKAGTFRKYTAFITLLRDFNLGFTITMATSVIKNFQGADLIGGQLIAAYDAVARDEANKLYSGIYCYNGTTGYSWMVITADPAKPGLGIGPWISNGVDMVTTANKLQSGSSRVLAPEARLYYSQLESKTADGGKRQAWKAVFEDTGSPIVGPQLFSSNCGAWVTVTGVTYGNLPLDEFIFNLDSSGKVVSVENLALRVKLLKLDY